MTQYIDKAAVVAEIKSYKNSFCDRNGYLEDSETNGLAYDTLCDLEDSIDTLEVKEVDLDKEFNDFLDNIEGVPRMWHSDEQIEWGKDIAKHFFELGLNAKKGGIT